MPRIEGLANIKLNCPYFLPEKTGSEWAQSINDVKCIVGNIQKRENISEWYSFYRAFNPDTSTSFSLEDTTNERFAAVIDGLKFDETTREPYIEYASTEDGNIVGFGDLPNIGIFFTNATNVNYEAQHIDSTNSNYGQDASSFGEAQNIANGLDSLHLSASSTSSSGISNINIGTVYPIKLETICLDINCYIFKSLEDATEYIESGDSSKALNSSQDEASYEDQLHYIKCNTYSTNSTGSSKTSIGIHNMYFKLPAEARICGYVTNNLPYNIRVKVSNCDSFSYRTIPIGEWATVSTSVFNSSNTLNNLWTYDYGKLLTADGITYYMGILSKTFPIFASENDANLYNANQIDDSSALNKGKPDYSSSLIKTGNPIDDQEADQFDGSAHEPALTKQYYITEAQMRNMANLLYSADTQDALIAGLAMHGNNPIADIVDCYRPLIDISDFVTTSTSGNVFFGSYESNLSGWTGINTHGRLKVLGSSFIGRVTNDFRDYTNIRLTLWLPLFGTLDLPTDIFMGKTLTIKCAADLRSHNLRFYIFADGMLYTYRDCSFGQTITLMGNDTSAKARQNINGMMSLASTVVSAGMSKGSLLTAGMDIADTLVDLNQDSSRTYVGSQSSGTGIHDIMYPYIIIEIRNSIEPKQLTAKFGRPSNTICRVAEVAGYTQIDNIHLECDATETELNELNSLLSQGIIV